MTMLSDITGPSAAAPPDAYREEAELELHARVAKVLQWNIAIPRNRIHVHVERDWVTLRGVVERSYESLCAEALAERVPGVIGVRNEIEVRPREQP